MHVALVVGAGASVAEAMTHRPRQTAMHPPTDATFFEKARQLGRASERALDTAARQLGLRSPFGDRPPRMEEFFGDVYFALAQSQGRGPALVAYRELIRAYGAVLAQTTNWFAMRVRGEFGQVLRTIVRMRGLDRLTIVTFNQDLVVENGLSALPYHRRWCISEGYGPIALTMTNTAGGQARFATHDASCDHGIPIELLKLHGSLNWQLMTRSHNPAYRDLFPSQDRRQNLECITDRLIAVSLTRRRGNRRWRLWPQVVPPVYDKLGIVQARFQPLWRQAEERLASADRIAVIGYSMPATDVHASNLLKRAIGRNQRLKQLDVVNPDPEGASRMAAITEIRGFAWSRDIRRFVETLV